MANGRKKKPTIRDIADLVGVHHSTVSRALDSQQRRKISPKVVRQVEKAAQKLGYTPNVAASALRRNRSFAVGVLVPDITNPVFPPILRGIQDVAETEGYTVIISNTDDSRLKEQSAVQMMQGRAIEGIIIATAQLDDPTVEACVKNNLPLVMVNRTVQQGGVNAVIVDMDFGVRSALDHLRELGHTKIAHIAGPLGTSTGHTRLQAFKAYMKLHDLDDSLVEPTEKYTVEQGKKACEALLARGAEFTAILAGNDLIALGCIDALNDHGIQVPGGVSVIGGNDMPMLSRMVPALTSIRIPKYEMGFQAATILFDAINGKDRDPLVIRLQPELIVRESTAPVADLKQAKAAR